MTPIATFTIADDHPSLPGHFPGRPVVPGVVLLDRAVRAILAAHAGCAASFPAGFPSVKFTRPVLPGQAVTVACAPASHGRIAFLCSVDGSPVARGSLTVQ